MVIVTSTLLDTPFAVLKVTLVMPVLNFALSLKVALPSSPVFALAGVTETIFFPDASTLAVTFSPFTLQSPLPVTVMVTDDCFNFLMVIAFAEAIIAVAVHSVGVGDGVGVVDVATPRLMIACTGVLQFLIVTFPNCPSLLYPHAQTVPPDFRAIV